MDNKYVFSMDLLNMYAKLRKLIYKSLLILVDIPTQNILTIKFKINNIKLGILHMMIPPKSFLKISRFFINT